MIPVIRAADVKSKVCDEGGRLGGCGRSGWMCLTGHQTSDLDDPSKGPEMILGFPWNMFTLLLL